MPFVWLLALVPAALLVHHVLHAGAIWTFVVGAGAIVPLAEWIRRATDAVAERTGGAIGGLLNVTFGNAAELVLALFVLAAGRPDVVKAQITGAIIGNGLLGFGLAITVGALARQRITFDPQRAGHLASLLVLVLVALLLPALFDYTERTLVASADASMLDERLSLAVAIVLLAVYAANLVYTLVTHRDVFAEERHAAAKPQRRAAAKSHGRGAAKPQADAAVKAGGHAWPLWRAIAVLAAATAATAWMAELVAGALEETARTVNVSTFFLGVIVLAIVGNAAEYLSSMHFARQGRIGLVVGITIGSTIQIALLTAPVLVIASNLMGRPMNLVFSDPLELVAIASVALVINAITRDGEATWFEGVMLLAVYALLGAAFFLATPGSGA